MTNPVNNNSDPQDDDLQKALAAFGDDVLDLLNDDDDEFDGFEDATEQADNKLAPKSSVPQAESSSDDATRNKQIDALLDRFEAKFGQESTLGYAGSVAVACSKAASRPPSDTARFVVFSTGNRQLALPLPSVLEIARCGQLTSLPRTTKWLCGVTNLRGELIPVIDPRLLFRLPAENQTHRFRHQKLIVTQSKLSASRAGLLVDRISGIHVLPPEDSASLPKEIENLRDVSQGVSHWNDQIVVLLDPDKLFSHNELQTYAG